MGGLPWALAAAALGGALAALGLRGARWTRRLAAAGGAAALTGGAVVAWPAAEADAELAGALPERRRDDGYLSSAACRSCHPGQHASWHRTYHRTMTQVATPEAVRAPFDGRILRERGRAFAVLRVDDAFYAAEVPPERTAPLEPTGEWWRGLSSIWRIVMTTGSHQLQGYWVESAEGELQQFPFVYLIREGRWMANADSFLQPPPAEDAPLKRFVWSTDCAQCHSTGGPWDPSAQATGPSAVAELGIACESCHGPAEEHARLNRSPLRRYALHAKGEGDPSIVNPARLDGVRSAAVCGRCHAVHPPEVDGPGAYAFRPGDRLEAHLPLHEVDETVAAARALSDLTALSDDDRETVSAFWTDGSVRVAGREHSGLVRSGCHTEGGLACTDCHRMHGADPDDQLDPRVAGDAMCTACHAAIGADPEAHSHHPPEAPGGACVDCHMPYSSYGLLAATRSHRLDRPAATGVAGRDRPNACNLCHLDRSLGWTADHLARWYGRPRPALGAVHESAPAGVVWMLSGDAAQRGIAAWHAGWGPARAASDAAALKTALAVLLEDPYAAVRQLAAGSLNALEPGAVDLDAVTRAPRPALHRRLRARFGAADGAPSDALVERLRARRDDTPTWVSE
jgi:predicted CXXCH cytochrome family protein